MDALLELLSEKEANVYMTLLRLGQSTAQEISNKAQLNRVTTYDILKSLQEKGYVSYVIISNVKHFEAADPKKFLHDLKVKQIRIKQALPKLEAIKHSIKKKPQVEMYEQIAGIKTILNDILEERKETLFIGSYKMIEKLSYNFPNFIKRKRDRNMFSKVITTDTKEMRNYDTNKKFIELKLVKEKFPVTKIIYADKVAYLTFEEQNSIGILIKNKQIAQTERLLFEMMW